MKATQIAIGAYDQSVDLRIGPINGMLQQWPAFIFHEKLVGHAHAAAKSARQQDAEGFGVRRSFH